jgi:hypothetical protein
MCKPNTNNVQILLFVMQTRFKLCVNIGQTTYKQCANTFVLYANKIQTARKPQIMMVRRNNPPWWREAGESGTKKLYQPEPRPVIYIVPITSILGRLPLVPAGDHGTIPAAMRHRKKELFEYGQCDESRRPGTGSKLYFINSWAMCWPTDHAKKPLTG